MDFRKLLSPKILTIVLILVVLIVVGLKLIPQSNPVAQVSPEAIVQPPVPSIKDVPNNTFTPKLVPGPQILSKPAISLNNGEDAAIQEQLDRDRQQQRLTKELKNKLEQTDLQLEEEKALAEINKLKKENMGAFDEPNSDGQTNLPEIIVDYIGGDSVKKEAIISIGGTTYQVKDKSNPTENVQVVSISDTGITVHFNAPINLTKTIDYKPE